MVELKNDQEIKGYVEEVSSAMDLVLRQCNINSNGEVVDQHIVCGDSIRFVHIPPHVHVTQLANSFVRKLDQSERRNAPNKIVVSHNSNKRK